MNMEVFEKNYSIGKHFEKFMNDIEFNREHDAIKTPWENLNNKLNGGLYPYTFILYREKYSSKVTVGTEMSIGRGGTYQWAEGNITNSNFIYEIILNYNFGVRKNKYYKVKVEGFDYQHYPYSGRTHKRKYTFNTNCYLVPKIDYTKVFDYFGIKILKGLKITIKRMNSVLSFEHQEIQKMNNYYDHDRYNDFCIYNKENNKLTVFIGNKHYSNDYILFKD